MKILDINRLTKSFGGLVAVDEVSLYVDQGEIVGLIGPNGSGKTTLFNCVTGVHRFDRGSIKFHGERIDGMRREQIAKKGISRTFQLTRVFRELSALDNVLLAQKHVGESMLKTIYHKSSPEVRTRADKLLEFVDLIHLKNEPAGDLSYGQQKLLEIAMALMPYPKLILMDEPTAGVNPTMVEKLKGYIRQARDRGLTIFLVEHNVDVVMDLSERIYVLDHGKKIAQGVPEEIRSNKAVLDAYFGG